MTIYHHALLRWAHYQRVFQVDAVELKIHEFISDDLSSHFIMRLKVLLVVGLNMILEFESITQHLLFPMCFKRKAHESIKTSKTVRRQNI
ncbi:CLUMA_CG007048, isoform A [Clunio marinus]|uniref:CLUMA_CG007048, isoform A n=1 Tax=Clunio marinus TaxID=568069 RepID=A0A1J1HZX4_9DIPT|nr:CLUMA_CG007048, isoform A [Clunio marinus]